VHDLNLAVRADAHSGMEGRAAGSGSRLSDYMRLFVSDWEARYTEST
jgi:hypothetical protein